MAGILSPKTGWLDYNQIWEPDVRIYMLLGQRSDGKTYGIVRDSIIHYLQTGTPSAYIRRFSESLKSTTDIRDLCRPHTQTIIKHSKKHWDGYRYQGRRFYLTSGVDDKTQVDETAFLRCYALNTWENSKGADAGNVHNVIFDEYVSASKYLPNEYSIFENVLSSILRHRTTSRLIMLGNPVNMICPYYDEFDIKIHRMKPGDIVYRVSQSGVKMKFIYIPAMDKKFRKSAGIFDFKKQSTINTGYWEFGEFPHLPDVEMLNVSEKLAEFAIFFRNQMALCRMFYYAGIVYAYWDYIDDGDDLFSDKNVTLFSDVHLFQNNVFTAFPRDSLTKLYLECVQSNRQYFADNKTGNLVKMWYQDFVLRGGRFV